MTTMQRTSGISLLLLGCLLLVGIATSEALVGNPTSQAELLANKGKVAPKPARVRGANDVTGVLTVDGNSNAFQESVTGFSVTYPSGVENGAGQSTVPIKATDVEFGSILDGTGGGDSKRKSAAAVPRVAGDVTVVEGTFQITTDINPTTNTITLNDLITYPGPDHVRHPKIEITLSSSWLSQFVNIVEKSSSFPAKVAAQVQNGVVTFSFSNFTSATPHCLAATFQLEQCDKTKLCCDSNGQLKANGTLCRKSTNVCDKPDFCDGVNEDCADNTAEDGDLCSWLPPHYGGVKNPYMADASSLKSFIASAAQAAAHMDVASTASAAGAASPQYAGGYGGSKHLTECHGRCDKGKCKVDYNTNYCCRFKSAGGEGEFPGYNYKGDGGSYDEGHYGGGDGGHYKYGGGGRKYGGGDSGYGGDEYHKYNEWKPTPEDSSSGYEYHEHNEWKPTPDDSSSGYDYYKDNDWKPTPDDKPSGHDYYKDNDWKTTPGDKPSGDDGYWGEDEDNYGGHGYDGYKGEGKGYDRPHHGDYNSTGGHGDYNSTNNSTRGYGGDKPSGGDYQDIKYGRGEGRYGGSGGGYGRGGSGDGYRHGGSSGYGGSSGGYGRRGPGYGGSGGHGRGGSGDGYRPRHGYGGSSGGGYRGKDDGEYRQRYAATAATTAGYSDYICWGES